MEVFGYFTLSLLLQYWRQYIHWQWSFLSSKCPTSTKVNNIPWTLQISSFKFDLFLLKVSNNFLWTVRSPWWGASIYFLTVSGRGPQCWQSVWERWLLVQCGDYDIKNMEGSLQRSVLSITEHILLYYTIIIQSL